MEGVGKGGQYCKIYLQESDQIPTVNINENSPPASTRRRGRGTILKYTKTVCSS